MRTMLSVMVSSMLLAAPAAAQVTEPTDKQVDETTPPGEPASPPSVELGKQAVAAAPKAAVENDDHQETLWGEGDIDHGGYGGPELKIGRVAAGDAVFFGGKGGWIIDHQLVIGGGGWGMTNRRDAPARLQSAAPLADRRVINVGYGGGLLEYFIKPKSVVHATVSLLVGGGGVNLRDRPADCHGDRDCLNRYEDDDPGLSDSFFILEPEAGAEVNVVKFMRLNAGVSYRYVTGIGGIGFENDDLRSFNGTFTVKFGAF